MDHPIDHMLDNMGALKMATSERVLMPYHEAKAEAQRLNTVAKEFWDSHCTGKFDDRWQMRRDNPDAPADGYVVTLGLFFGVHETPDAVYLTNRGVLAGDGRVRKEDGTLLTVSEEELQKAQWSVKENNWSEW